MNPFFARIMNFSESMLDRSAPAEFAESAVQTTPADCSPLDVASRAPPRVLHEPPILPPVPLACELGPQGRTGRGRVERLVRRVIHPPEWCDDGTISRLCALHKLCTLLEEAA